MDKPGGGASGGGGGSWHRFRVEKPRPAAVRRSSSVAEAGSSLGILADGGGGGGSGAEGMEGVEGEGSPSTGADSTTTTTTTTTAAVGTLAMYACLRCRNSKKKCDRLLPECTACKRLGARCFFPSPVASSATQAASLRARVAWLSAFVESLMPVGSAPVSCYETGFDLHSLPNLARPADRPGGPAATTTAGPEDYDMDGGGGGGGGGGAIAVARAPSTSSIHQQPTPSSMGIPEPSSAGHLGAASGPSPPGAPPPPSSTASSRPPRYLVSEALSVKPKFPPIRSFTGQFGRMHLVRAYFRHMHRSYPFLYEGAVVEAAESHVGHALFEEGYDIDLTSARLYLVMVLGLEGISRFGGSSSGGGPRAGESVAASDDADRTVGAAAFARVRVPYQEIVQACLSNRCVRAVEVLLLLTLYALFDPDGWSAWVLVGMLGREAVLLGLNRRRPADAAPPAELQQREFRHRLFWSIFSIDRLVASVYGLALAVQDYDATLSLPGVTTEEFAASEQAEHITTLQIARQAIALRDIEGRCLSLVHLGGGGGCGGGPGTTGQDQALSLSLSHPAAPFQPQPPQRHTGGRHLPPSLRERRAMVDELRGAADNWYTQGTLLARREAHAVHFHNTITWLNTNYHGMLMLLYCPSLFHAGPAAPEDLLDLHRTVRKYVQSVHAQFVDRQLALNWTTLSRMLLVCRMLLHGYLNLCCGPAEEAGPGAAGGPLGLPPHHHHHHHHHPGHLPVLLAEQLDMVIQCFDILHAFQPGWLFASQGAVLYRRLEVAFRHRLRQLHSREAAAQPPQQPQQPPPDHRHPSSPPSHGPATTAAAAAARKEDIDIANDVHDICDEVEQLLQQALGVASTYNYLAGEPRTRPHKVPGHG